MGSMGGVVIDFTAWRSGFGLFKGEVALGPNEVGF